MIRQWYHDLSKQRKIDNFQSHGFSVSDSIVCPTCVFRMIADTYAAVIHQMTVALIHTVFIVLLGSIHYFIRVNLEPLIFISFLQLSRQIVPLWPGGQFSVASEATGFFSHIVEVQFTTVRRDNPAGKLNACFSFSGTFREHQFLTGEHFSDYCVVDFSLCTFLIQNFLERSHFLEGISAFVHLFLILCALLIW